MSLKAVALAYGGQWIGKGIDRALDLAPDPYNKALTVGLAVGLPIATKFVKMGETAETVAILVGGYLSTKIWDYVEQAMVTPTAIRRVTQVTRAVPWTAAETPGGAPEFYPPTYGQAIRPQVVGRSIPEKNHVRYVVT